MRKTGKHFNLDAIVGTWESVNLNPTVMIYRDRKDYLLSVIHINETSQQANPSTCEIRSNDDGYFVYLNMKRNRLEYNPLSDVITITHLGDYLRN
jgi:hypothetical protein